jgi:hypothetical protein
MSPELLHLYKELQKVGAYIIRYPNDPKLHLIVIDRLTLTNTDEFGVPEVRRQLLLYLFGPENVQSAMPQTEQRVCQLLGIQYRGNKFCRNLPEVELPF